MIKTILIPNSFSNKTIGQSYNCDFINGKYAYGEDAEIRGNFWLECTLPAVPLVGSVIELGGIDEEQVMKHLTEIFHKCYWFRELLKKYRDENYEYLGDITLLETLSHFAGHKHVVESIYEGSWYVDRVDFRVNDEFMYVEIHHEY